MSRIETEIWEFSLKLGVMNTKRSWVFRGPIASLAESDRRLLVALLDGDEELLGLYDAALGSVEGTVMLELFVRLLRRLNGNLGAAVPCVPSPSPSDARARSGG